MPKPTGLDRDSSLEIDKAPGIFDPCREAQTVNEQYTPREAVSPANNQTFT